ncbi:uncharacterized protein B0T23DRAFT_408018 [Neurospora hispaniola]|uniref:Uncharacterized protein n=1 Tax=Neurospora hispaniola TaxID=588809 RepID=A0AAJ0I044_9PEZI|nr:hypothetical protein B0T23DRAFT_408018 [Neurospora hispaniola]
MRTRWRGRENTRQSPFFHLLRPSLPRVSAVFIPSVLSPALTTEVAMSPIPVPRSPSFLHTGWGPDHRGTLGTSLRLNLPLSSYARILGWGSTTMRFLLWWCLVNKAHGGPAQHAHPSCPSSCRYHSDNSVDHFQYDPSSSVLLFFNAKP